MIYVASSWRNVHYPAVVKALVSDGHEVYDFRKPKPGSDGFHWSEIDPDWKNWDRAAYRAGLAHPLAEDGYALDQEALDRCDAGLLVMPCGRSAHLEAGYLLGGGRPVAIYLPEPCEPELMYKMASRLLIHQTEVLDWAKSVHKRVAAEAL